MIVEGNGVYYVYSSHFIKKEIQNKNVSHRRNCIFLFNLQFPRWTKYKGFQNWENSPH